MAYKRFFGFKQIFGRFIVLVVLQGRMGAALAAPGRLLLAAKAAPTGNIARALK
jgi:hypothetical protein